MLDEKQIRPFIDLAEDIYIHPEIGFKEVNTRNRIIKALSDNDIEYQDVAYTGIKATLASSIKGPNIGLICEMDGVPTLNHPFANTKQDNVAHSCGHYSQIGIMLAVFIALKKNNIVDKFGGKVTLLACPGEEFCNLDYRQSLISRGLIKFPSGKQEMIYENIIDDLDLIISCHAMQGNNPFDCEIGASLNGFVHKLITIYGKASHAGAAPQNGINALNCANLTISAINNLRETFVSDPTLRVHFYLPEGGQSVNSIPSRCQIEMYIRSKEIDSIFETAKKIERCVKGCAMASDCNARIKNTAGYFPFLQDPNLSDFMLSHIEKYYQREKIKRNNHSFASGDIGDLSLFKPTIQVGISGFAGSIHGIDFKTIDLQKAYITPINYLYEAVVDLLENPNIVENITGEFKPIMSKTEYLIFLDNLNKTEDIIYNNEIEMEKK